MCSVNTVPVPVHTCETMAFSAILLSIFAKILTIIINNTYLANNNNINNNVVHDFILLLLLCIYIYSYIIMCIFKSYLYHDIMQPTTYHIVEFYVTTCHMS